MSFKLVIIDGKIKRHLGVNGHILDRVGKELTVQFVVAAMNNPAIKDAARHYGFTIDDLCMMYAAMVECVMPNPLIKDSTGFAQYLCASLQFIEPFRVENIMGTIHKELRPEMTDEERKSAIIEAAQTCSEQTWLQHTASRGEAEFSIEPSGTGSKSASGCASLIILGFTLGAATTLWALSP